MEGQRLTRLVVKINMTSNSFNNFNLSGVNFDTVNTPPPLDIGHVATKALCRLFRTMHCLKSKDQMNLTLFFHMKLYFLPVMSNINFIAAGFDKLPEFSQDYYICCWIDYLCYLE